MVANYSSIHFSFSEMEELSIDYFRNLWQKNVKDLESLCELWENMCKEDTIPDEGKFFYIHTVISGSKITLA